MNDQEILIAVAGLDGWLDVKEYSLTYDYAGESGEFSHIMGRDPNKLGELVGLLPYLTSRDAIIPVIEKRSNQGDTDQLILDIGCLLGGTCRQMILATPRQLCIALLEATGKWKV